MPKHSKEPFPTNGTLSQRILWVRKNNPEMTPMEAIKQGLITEREALWLAKREARWSGRSGQWWPT